jgi:transcriptional regulator with XRE-family HTH domain
MTKPPTPPSPPEGELIHRAQKRSGLTVVDAARRAGISRTRWNQIVSGYESVHGTRVPFQAPPETLARMALAVGVMPAQLREVHREDAAKELEELARRTPTRVPSVASPTLAAITALLNTLTPEEQEAVISQLPHYIQQVQHPPQQESDERDRNAS